MELSIQDNTILSMYNRNTPVRHIAQHIKRTEEYTQDRLEQLLEMDRFNDAETGSENELDTYA